MFSNDTLILWNSAGERAVAEGAGRGSACSPVRVGQWALQSSSGDAAAGAQTALVPCVQANKQFKQNVSLGAFVDLLIPATGQP